VQPELTTERLRLRPFLITDADAVSVLAGDQEIARNTLNIPYPYDRGHAEEWIASHIGQFQRREAVTYAVTRADDGALVGAVGLILDPDNDSAELGYWIGRDHWGSGYATEAARAVVAWAFRALELHRIHASHFPRNPASGRVLDKIGMRHEGRLREHVKKWGEYLDLERYGLLRKELDDAD
jgi:[ribosomal protein S5]-alanine N-acetyltransferase